MLLIQKGTSANLSDLGGLTQFGARLETLLPGEQSSDRHWHESEDELMLVVAGELTVIDNEGSHVLSPGDAAAWKAGVPDAHQAVNRSSAPCTYLICGTRVERDVVHYPDLGQTLYIDGTDWRLVDAGGAVVRSGREAAADDSRSTPLLPE